MARINHVALKVTDLEAATKFYENVFGFRQVKTGRSRGHISTGFGAGAGSSLAASARSWAAP